MLSVFLKKGQKGKIEHRSLLGSAFGMNTLGKEVGSSRGKGGAGMQLPLQ